MTHRYAVVDRYRVELRGKAAERFYLTLHYLADLVEMHMAGNKLGEGIDDSDYRLAYKTVVHSVGSPKASRTSHRGSFKSYTAAYFHILIKKKSLIGKNPTSETAYYNSVVDSCLQGAHDQHQQI